MVKNDDVFLNSANFWQQASPTFVLPPSSYTINLKPLTKVSKISWASQLLYEILYSLLERKFRKRQTSFLPKKLLQKARIALLGLKAIRLLNFGIFPWKVLFAKLSRPYVYSFWHIFQALPLFPALRLFQTLEFVKTSVQLARVVWCLLGQIEP